MNPQLLKNIIEAALLTANGPLPMVRLQALFCTEEGGENESQPSLEQIKAVLDDLSLDYVERGIELKQVSSGFRIQARQPMAQWLNKLSEEKPSRYSRALLETLALVAYRQPITRAGVEEIRGVSVSSSIIKTLIEREWIRIVGHRDVPGRPALYGTTRQFLDYFNLQGLGELPPLAEMRSIEDIQREFDLKFNEGMNEDLEAGSDGNPQAHAEDGIEEAEASIEMSSITSGDETMTESVAADIVADDIDHRTGAGDEADEVIRADDITATEIVESEDAHGDNNEHEMMAMDGDINAKAPAVETTDPAIAEIETENLTDMGATDVTVDDTDSVVDDSAAAIPVATSTG